MDDLEKLAQAFLVADDVLALRKGQHWGPLASIEIVSDPRMPRDCWALGNREGAIVVRDASEFIRQFRGVRGGVENP